VIPKKQILTYYSSCNKYLAFSSVLKGFQDRFTFFIFKFIVELSALLQSLFFFKVFRLVKHLLDQ